MYLTTHRVARIRKPDDPPYTQTDTSVHGFLYTHGEDFNVESADIEEVKTQNSQGQLAKKATDGIPPGGNAVLSYLDVVARDEVSRETLEESLRQFALQVGGTEQLPLETPTSEEVYVNYHISPRSYRDEVDWGDDFQELADQALELFNEWKTG